MSTWPMPSSSATRPAWSTPCSTRSPASCGPPSSRSPEPTRARLLLRRFRLDVGLLRLLAIASSGLSTEKALLPEPFRGACDAGEVFLTREFFAGLEQPQEQPCLARGLARIPTAVPVYVDNCIS